MEFRLGVIVKTSIKSRSSIFVEFGLQALASLLKANKFGPENNEDVSKLDPLMPLIFDCLKIKYDKVFKYVVLYVHLDYWHKSALFDDLIQIPVA